MCPTRLLLAVAAWGLFLCPLMEARAFVVLDARGPAEAASQQRQQKGPQTELSSSASPADATALAKTSVMVATTTLVVSKTVSGTPTAGPEPPTLVTSAPSSAGQPPPSGSSDGEDLLTASGAASNATMRNGYTSGMGSNHTLVITLSTVLSIVGFFVVLGAVSVCWHRRRSRRRFPYFFRRGITPIDDDEIATWKVARGEKPRCPAPVMGPGGVAIGFGPARPLSGGGLGEKEPAPSVRSASSSYTRKPSSVIVYPGHPPAASRHSEDGGRYAASPRHYGSYSSYGGSTKRSFDQDFPVLAPVQARAPNARAGLTDEAVPGDDPFLPSPKRQPSRLSKVPPPAPVRTRGPRSSSSSARSFNGETACCHHPGGYGSDLELSSSSSSSPPPAAARVSHEYYYYRHSSGHARIFSGSSIPPPRMSSDDYVVGGLSPRPPVREDEIGRAIG